MNLDRRKLAVTAFAAVLAQASLAAALPSVLLCPADTNAANSQSLQTNLDPTHQYFSKIDVVDCHTSTPTVAQLRAYDVVMTWSNVQLYMDRTTLGNNLADYIDGGGGVVQGMWNFWNSAGAYYPGGRFQTNGYSCIGTSGTASSGTLKPMPNDPTSPLVQGVTKGLTAVTYSTATPVVGATRIWDYTSGSAAIVTCTPNNHLRVDLNFNPVPSGWNAGGDGYIIMRNALIVAAQGLSPVRSSPGSNKFNDTSVNAATAPATFTFTNISSVPQTATGVSLMGTNASEFTVTRAPNWPVTLNPNETFTVDAAFAPAATGGRSATLVVALANSAAPAQVSLSGNGIAARLTATPPSLDFGGAALNSSVTGNVTIMNVSSSRTGISSLSVNDPAFAITQSPDLPIAFGAGGSFSVGLRFTPTQNGVTRDRLLIATSDPMSPYLVIPVSGYAGPPAIGTLTPVAFGSVNVGAKSAPQIMNVQNVGFSNLTLTDDIKVAGVNPGDFVVDSRGLVKGSVIPPQSSAPIAVTFAPAAIGVRAAQLVIATDDATNPALNVGLQGKGTTAMLMVGPQSLTFGTTRAGQTSTAQDVMVSGTGDGTLRVLAVTFSGANPGDFVQSAGSKAPFQITTGMSAKLSFACSPSNIGMLSATANIVTDVGTGTVMLTCNAISPRISITPNVVDFGLVPVGANSDKITIKIDNTGSDTLTLKSVTIAGSDQVDFTSTDAPSTFPVSIPAGMSLSFTAVFSPQKPVTEQAEIDLLTDDPLLPTARIPLRGQGVMAGLSVSPATVDCGTVMVGATAEPQGVWVTNQGSLALTIDSLTVTGAASSAFRTDRTIDKNNPVTLTPGQTLSLNVTFAPVLDGNASAALRIGASALPSPAQVTLKGVGFKPVIKIQVPGSAPAASPVVDFGDQPIGQASSLHEVELVNGTKQPLTVSMITTDNEAFTVDTSKSQLSIAAGGSTVVSIAFTPTAAGEAKAMMSVKIQGTNQTPAVLQLVGNGIDTGFNGGGCGVGGARRFGFGGLGGLFAVIALGFVCALGRRRRDSGAGRN